MNHILSPSLPSQAQGLLAESSWWRTKKAGPSTHWSRWRSPTWSGLNRSSTSTTRRRCWLRSTTPSLSDCKFAPVLSHGHTVGEEGGVTEGQSVPGRNLKSLLVRHLVTPNKFSICQTNMNEVLNAACVHFIWVLIDFAKRGWLFVLFCFLQRWY